MVSIRSSATSTTSSIAWKSGVSGLWSTADDWSGGKVPGAGDQILIAAPGAYTVTIDGAEAAGSLVIDAPHAEVDDIGSLAIAGSLMVDSGTFRLSKGGLLEGGTVAAIGTGRFISRGGALKDVKYLGTLSLALDGARLTLDGGDSFADSMGAGTGDIDVTGNHSELSLREGQVLDSTTIHLGSADGAKLRAQDPRHTVALGPNVSVIQSGTNAEISVVAATTLINQGTITAGLSGAATIISSALNSTFSNQGTLIATNHGTIVTLANLSVGSLDHFSTIDGGVLELGSGTLSNAGNTLSLGVGRSLLLEGGTIEGGTIISTGDVLGIIGGTLDDTSFIGTLDLTSTSESMTIEGGLNGSGTMSGPSVLDVTGIDASVYLPGNQTLGDAKINLGSDTGAAWLDVGGGSTLTLGPMMQVVSAGLGGFVGGDTFIGYTILNQGTIVAQTIGGTLVVGSGGDASSFTNTGSLIATNGGTLVIEGNVTTNGLGQFSTSSGGTVYLAGTLANTGSTLTLGSGHQLAVGTSNGVARIVGGTVKDTGGGLIAAGGLLDDVSYVGSLSLASASSTLLVENGLAVSTGVIDIGSAGALFALLGSQTLDSDTIGLGGDGGAATLESYDGNSGTTVTLTLGSQLAIDQIGSQAVIELNYSSGGTLVSNGSITAGEKGGGLLSFSDAPETTGTFDNAGNLVVLGGATVDVGVITINTGHLSDNGGVLRFMAGLTNNGVVDVASGTASFSEPVSGHGTLQIGGAGTLTLQFGTTADQTASFLPDGGTLSLGNSNDFLGGIADFGTGDDIVLLKTSETEFTYSDGLLTVLDSGKTVASLHFAGSYVQSSFALSTSDGNTVIAFK